MPVLSINYNVIALRCYLMNVSCDFGRPFLFVWKAFSIKNRRHVVVGKHEQLSAINKIQVSLMQKSVQVEMLACITKLIQLFRYYTI